LRYSEEGYAIRTQLERNVAPPDWYLDKTELLPGQEFYLQAFDRLTTCRSVGNGAVSRIPWTATWEYAKAEELTLDEFRVFQYVIEVMDSEYIRWVSEKAGKD
jgi:hypothetical protein